MPYIDERSFPRHVITYRIEQLFTKFLSLLNDVDGSYGDINVSTWLSFRDFPNTLDSRTLRERMANSFTTGYEEVNKFM